VTNLLGPGNGTQDPPATTTTTVRASGGSNAADEESRRIWMIIAGLAGVGVLVALLTWRYWLLTRPGLDLDEPGEHGHGPYGSEPDPYGAGPPPPGRARGGVPPSGAAGPAARAKPRRPGQPKGEHSSGRRRSGRGADPFWDDPGPAGGPPGGSYAAPGGMGQGGAVTGRPPSRGSGSSSGGPPPGARKGPRPRSAPGQGQARPPSGRRPPAQGGPPPPEWGPAEDVDMWGNPRRG
jgi:hypothetical protein